jgi:hypothetical protein
MLFASFILFLAKFSAFFCSFFFFFSAKSALKSFDGGGGCALGFPLNL